VARLTAILLHVGLAGPADQFCIPGVCTAFGSEAGRFEGLGRGSRFWFLAGVVVVVVLAAGEEFVLE